MKAFILTVALALVSTTAMAEGKGGPHGGGKKHMSRMQQELGLTEDQVTQMREIRQSGGSKEEVQAVLTPEQQAKANELRTESRAERHAIREQRRAAMQQELGLTEEQITKMREIRESGGSRQEVQAVLTEEQQAKAKELRAERVAKGGDRFTRMQQHVGLSDEQVAQMKEVRAQGGSRDEILAVMTDEQRQQFDALRKAHGGKHKPE